MLETKRVYEPESPKDGKRILVERLWPRGIRKAALQLDGWNKDVAPSTELRKWFSHDPEKWSEFQKRYFEELERHPDAWEPLVREAKRGHVTLLFSSHDVEHNNAVALARFLARKAKPARAARGSAPARKRQAARTLHRR